MDRRKFLSIALAGVVAFFIPSQTQAMIASRFYKGTSTGQILGSSEEGAPWEVKVNLGPEYTVLGVYQRGDELYAQVKYQDFVFFLKSSDGTTWYTSAYTPPAI
jgi:hypothetical protein